MKNEETYNKIMEIINNHDLNSGVYIDSEEEEYILVLESWEDHKLIKNALEQDDINIESIEYGFSDEWITCSNCGHAIYITPGYYGDRPRYAIFNGELLCGDCILLPQYIDEYIESVTNNCKNAINLSIIHEDKLEEMGWEKLEEKYSSGLYEWSTDDPCKILKGLQKLYPNYDIIFDYFPSQFMIQFHTWIKKQEDE